MSLLYTDIVIASMLCLFFNSNKSASYFNSNLDIAIFECNAAKIKAEFPSESFAVKGVT